MVKMRIGLGVLLGCLLGGGGLAQGQHLPTVEQILAWRPRQEGVAISTPTPEEYARCQVKVTADQKGGRGYVLLDPQGRILRRFFASNGKQIDTWSYYKDGKEVYREIDSKQGNRPDRRPRPDQYRWFHEAGTKWGLDQDEDGKIDSWKRISAEEVAQEAYQALLHRDFARLRALLISESEMQALGLPTAQMEQLRQHLQQAPSRFAETANRLAALPHVQFIQIEAAAPQCVPAEEAGGQDLIQYPSRGILLEYGSEKEKKQEWLQTGRLLLIGAAWRLTEVPYLGSLAEQGSAPELQQLMEQLSELDKTAPKMPAEGGPDPAFLNYNLRRADLVEKIAAWYGQHQPDRAAEWFKQLADNLSAAAQYAPADKVETPLGRLRRLQEQISRQAPGSNLAGYVAFRVLWTEYNGKLGQDSKAQAEWLEKLAQFVQTYPQADDTPDALRYIAMGYEFAGKDEDAKRCWQQLASHFPNHPSAKQAQGAVRRLELTGQVLALQGKTASGEDFDLSSLRGKVVLVYYWASYGKTREEDFTRLKQLAEKYGPKGLAIVTVNLDDQPEDGLALLKQVSFPAVHLVQPAGDGGGLNGPLATQYGILGVPTLFLVGKDGKVLHRNLQMSNLEEAVQKAL